MKKRQLIFCNINSIVYQVVDNCINLFDSLPVGRQSEANIYIQLYCNIYNIVERRKKVLT